MRFLKKYVLRNDLENDIRNDNLPWDYMRTYDMILLK